MLKEEQLDGLCFRAPMLLLNDFWTSSLLFFCLLLHPSLFSVREQNGNDSCLPRTPAVHFFISPSISLYRLYHKGRASCQHASLTFFSSEEPNTFTSSRNATVKLTKTRDIQKIGALTLVATTGNKLRVFRLK